MCYGLSLMLQQQAAFLLLVLSGCQASSACQLPIVPASGGTDTVPWQPCEKLARKHIRLFSLPREGEKPQVMNLVPVTPLTFLCSSQHWGNHTMFAVSALNEAPQTLVQGVGMLGSCSTSLLLSLCLFPKRKVRSRCSYQALSRGSLEEELTWESEISLLTHFSVAVFSTVPPWG